MRNCERRHRVHRGFSPSETSVISVADAGRFAYCLAAALVLVSSGCGRKPPPGPPGPPPTVETPRGAFEVFKAALRSGDHGAVYDLMSEDARERVDADIKETVDSAEVMGDLAPNLLGFDPAEIAYLSPREAYVKVMKGASEATEKLESSIGAAASGLAEAKFVKAETDDDRSTVTVELRGGGKVRLELVRKGEGWNLAEPPSAARAGPGSD